jgi:hypothetical protein
MSHLAFHDTSPPYSLPLFSAVLRSAVDLRVARSFQPAGTMEHTPVVDAGARHDVFVMLPIS